jgi:O-antigen/teichoic acid export membrane protein
MSLAQKTFTGILWKFSEQIGRRGIGVLITLLLARFLAPEDYGLVAMMAVFLAIAQQLMDSGFRQALIRLQGARQVDFNTAEFYEETRLIMLIRVAGLNVLIHSFQVVQVAVLSRELNFKAQLQASIPAGIISGVIAVGLAYLGVGVWALIAQMLLSTFFTTVLLWRIQGWRPTLGFSRQTLGQMYNFGYKLFLSGLLDIVFKNIYVVVIAKIFAASTAGLYFFANKLKEIVISQIVAAIQAVTYPALATMQHDNARLKAGYRKVIGVTTFLLFPVMLFLAALADPLFQFVLPNKWLPAVLYLQLMCFAGLMYPLHSINLNVLQVKGRSDLFLYLEVIKKVLLVIILSISIHFGIIGILIGQIISSILAYLPNSYFTVKLINYSVREQISDFMPGLLLSSVVGFVNYLAVTILPWHPLIELIVFGSLAVGLYLLGAYQLKFEALHLAVDMMKQRREKKATKNTAPVAT